MSTVPPEKLLPAAQCLLSFFMSRPCPHSEHRLGRTLLQQVLAGIPFNFLLSRVLPAPIPSLKSLSSTKLSLISPRSSSRRAEPRYESRPTIPPEGMKKNILPTLRRVPLSAPVTSLNNVLLKPSTRSLLLMKKNPPTGNKDSADVEESDGPIGDQRWRVKETFREEFATAAYQRAS
ncbi:hypothetical protein E4U56_005730 [Claviceps arundinis]|uniref:Uncharacterized protein n=1 Tax=Claviceps arundinis TaxID=1623583 RepID=A0A9P7MM56_9HYPO|nr:hypothetical protein E4U56_005730 [Claviceps arundinis]